MVFQLDCVETIRKELIMLGRTRFRLAYKILVSDPTVSKRYEMLNWCFDNTPFFYSSFNYGLLYSRYDIEIFCFDSYNDAIQFKLIFGGI